MLDHTAKYCINLNHREDRLDEYRRNHVATGWQYGEIARFDAIEDKDFGALGCAKSHISSLTQYLTETDLPYVMVLEDDFDFEITRDEFAERLAAVNVSPIGDVWDVLMLCGTGVSTQGQPENGVVQVFQASTTSGYIVRRDYAWKLLAHWVTATANLEKFRTFLARDIDGAMVHTPVANRWAVDRAWQELQATDDWYLFTPRIGRQRHSFSDIEGKQTDYARMFYA